LYEWTVESDAQQHAGDEPFNNTDGSLNNAICHSAESFRNYASAAVELVLI